MPNLFRLHPIEGMDAHRGYPLFYVLYNTMIHGRAPCVSLQRAIASRRDIGLTSRIKTNFKQD